MRDVALLTLISFILFMSRGITGPVSSLYAESLGADYVAIGLLGTVSSLTAVAASAFWGNLSDLLRQRRSILLFGLALLALSECLVALAPDFRFLYAWRVLGGVAQAAFATSSLALMGDLLEARSDARGRRMGTYRGLSSLGFGLMALNAGAIADRFALNAPFWLSAALALTAGIIALRIHEPRVASERLTLDRLLTLLRQIPVSSRRRLDAIRQRRWIADLAGRPAEGAIALPLAPLLISSLLWSLVNGAVYAVWANYMVGEIGFTPTVMSRLWAIASLTEFPLMIVAGWLSDRIGRLTMLSLGFVAWCLVFIGYIVAPIMPWIVVVQLLRGFAYSAFTATAMAYAAEVRGYAQRGRISGLYASAGGLGAILGSAMGGSLAQWLGFRSMFGANAALILGGAVYLAIMAIRQRRTVAGVLTAE